MAALRRIRNMLRTEPCIRRITAAIVLLATAAALAQEARSGELIQNDGGTLKLRPRAAAAGPNVRLGEVLAFGEADPELFTRLADHPVLTGQPAGATVTVTHEAVVQRLRELGVNLARVTVLGAAACEVTLEAGATPTAESDESGPATGPFRLAAHATPVARDGGTLRGRIREFIAAELRDLGGEPEIEFERAAEPLLSLAGPAHEFVIRSADREKLGLREVQVVIRRDGQIQRTVPLSLRVRLSKSVLVARKPLNLGGFIKPDDVALETRLFERGSRPGLDDPRAAVGHQVTRFVPAGQMVTAADIKTVDMVARAQRVTVAGGHGGVALRLDGVALDAGTLGETVRVRLGDARGERRIRRGTVTDFGTVRLID